jgi:hypothetical protein
VSDAAVPPSAPPSAAAAAAPEPGAAPEPDLDEQAPGWPAGTTRRQVREAVAGWCALQQRLGALQAEESDDLDVPDIRRPAAQPAPPPESVRAEAQDAAAITDAEALLALAQDALAAEQTAHPDIARRRRPQLTAHLDPLSGWARQADGELLPPSSLRQVMRTLPGRGGVLRLRRFTAADLRRHDLGRTAREVSAGLRELLGTLDGERCRFPGCTRHQKLHAHHVVYWSHGGLADLDNLVKREDDP